MAYVPPRRLLLIDDDPLVRRTLAQLLRNVGHTVEEADGGAAGLVILSQRPVDLVLTDLGMPGLTGWQVARAVKARRPHLPVVLVTGWANTIATDQRERALVDAILPKPCQLQEIQAVIARLTGEAACAGVKSHSLAVAPGAWGRVDGERDGVMRRQIPSQRARRCEQPASQAE